MAKKLPSQLDPKQGGVMSDDCGQDEEPGATTRLSKKEYAKKLRREAYQRAKEFKKTDPREIARKEKAKEQRRAVYQKAKERNKAARKTKEPKKELDLSASLRPASELDVRPLAPIISLDQVRKAAARRKQGPHKLDE